MLIIYVNPKDMPKKSYCYELLQETKKILQEQNETYEVLDLYKMGFNPVMSKQEVLSAKEDASEYIKNIQNKIIFYKKVLFIFPCWWGTFPAMLKGFFDRVFLKNFAYKMDNEIPTGLLSGVKAYILTTRGSPFLFSWYNGDIAALRSMRKGILKYCGFSPIKTMTIQNCLEFNEKRMPELSLKLEKLLNK